MANSYFWPLTWTRIHFARKLQVFLSPFLLNHTILKIVTHFHQQMHTVYINSHVVHVHELSYVFFFNLWVSCNLCPLGPKSQKIISKMWQFVILLKAFPSGSQIILIIQMNNHLLSVKKNENFSKILNNFGNVLDFWGPLCIFICELHMHTYIYIRTYEIHCHQSIEHTSMGFKAHYKNKSDWRQSVVPHQPASHEHIYGEKPHT